MINVNLKKITVPPYPHTQLILNDFKKTHATATESNRILAAEELCKKNNPYIPAVPSRQDYWYLVQLFSQNHHVHNDRLPYIFDLTNSPTIFLEKNRFIQKLLHHPNTPHSHQTIEKAIVTHQKVALSALDFNPHKWRIAPLPYDVLIRLQPDQITLERFNYHLDGCRLRLDGDLTGLIGGHTDFGGLAFIDSIWTHTQSRDIKTLLTIIPKDYGY